MGTFNKIMSLERQQPAQRAREEGRPAKKPLDVRPPSKNCNLVINITIPASDIEDLRGATNSLQAVRVRESDLEILKDTTYQLRKRTKKKIRQSDVARLAFRVMQKLALKEGALEEIIGQIKT